SPDYIGMRHYAYRRRWNSVLCVAERASRKPAASAAPYAQAPAVRATNDAMSRRPPYQRGTTALLEERQELATLQLTATVQQALGVNAVHLKARLGDVETDCLNCLHVWLLSIVGALTAPTFMALACR